jgi:deazaflavin-dependent oxidoreductase (nitroreductase family)
MRPLPHVDPTAPHGRLRSALLRVMSTRLFTAFERSLPFRLTMWRLAPGLIRVTGGRFARAFPFPTEVIETRDLRNGRPHRRVVAYFHDGDRVTTIASKGGMKADPFWFQNALADPNVRFAGRPYRADVVSDPASATRLWAIADRFFPSYAAYRAHAARYERTIPILQLIPR